MLDSDNALTKSFRLARDFIQENQSQDCALRLFRKRGKDARNYNTPTCDEVAALVVGDLTNLDYGKDVVVKKVSGHLQRVFETHASFIPLQYPILFPYGEDGWSEEIPLRQAIIEEGNRIRERVALREFIAFRIQERESEFDTILKARRLFQQFVVDCYTMIESQRLSFIRQHQNVIRSEVLNGLQDAINRGDTEAARAGQRIVLPASFTGGTRYMFHNCQNAMAICKKIGYPDLFITMTCNANWNEIKHHVASREHYADDRPDIVCRVFKMKLDNMMREFKLGKPFGKLNAGKFLFFECILDFVMCSLFVDNLLSLIYFNQ